MELGGPDYARAAPKVQDSQGFEVQGATGKGAGYRCWLCSIKLPFSIVVDELLRACCGCFAWSCLLMLLSCRTGVESFIHSVCIAWSEQARLQAGCAQQGRAQRQAWALRHGG